MPVTRDFDGQEGAEAYDALLDDDGSSSLEDRTFEELPDVEDLTQAVGDRNEDEALALDFDEFDPDAVGDEDIEEDNELDYRAATEQHEDDLDGLGPEDGAGEHPIARGEVEGLDQVLDADSVEGGEDHFTDFQARSLDDDDLKNLGYAEERGGETRAKPDKA